MSSLCSCWWPLGPARRMRRGSFLHSCTHACGSAQPRCRNAWYLAQCPIMKPAPKSNRPHSQNFIVQALFVQILLFRFGEALIVVDFVVKLHMFVFHSLHAGGPLRPARPLRRGGFLIAVLAQGGRHSHLWRSRSAWFLAQYHILKSTPMSR